MQGHWLRRTSHRLARSRAAGLAGRRFLALGGKVKELAQLAGISRHVARYLAAVTFAFCLLAVVAVVRLFPAPPKRVSIATAAAGTSFEQLGNRYREILARSGIELDVRLTTGSRANFELLQNGRSGVDVAFMTGWIERPPDVSRLLSLGVIFYSPIWIFHRAEMPLDRLSALGGRRIAVGPVGSAGRSAIDRILGRAGISAGTATLTDESGMAAAEALSAGSVDAAVLMSDFEAPAVQALLRSPAVRLLDMPLAEAFTRLFPELSRVVLPKGIVALEPPDPSVDKTLIATVNRVLIRDDLHPAIVQLLLQAMAQVHARPGIFNRSGEFPRGVDPEYTMAASALDFYKSGPTFLQRTMPLWLTAHVQRALALLLTLAAIAIPLMRYTPALIRWVVSERYVRLYRRLRTLEIELAGRPGPDQLQAMQRELDEIERAAVLVPTPVRHSAVFYDFMHHAGLLRSRICARLSPVAADASDRD